MAFADLHVHSSYSAHPSELFLQRIGTRESYTDPEAVYQLAMSRGMTFVTITDHNEIDGSLMLQEKYPLQAITGVEVTAYFPDNGCKIHILVYGFDVSQFQMINRLRSNIYELRDYIREQNLAHAVAHPTFSINKKLDLEHLERLFLLFDYFEGINGSRSRIGNEVLMDTLATLTPAKMDDLYNKHRIEPYSDTSWIKGMTGGSDDHGGLFIGKTHTCADAETPVQFLEALKNKCTTPGGRHNDFKGLAFSIYKVAYEFSKTRSTSLSFPLFHALNRLIFEQQPMRIKDKLMFEKMKYSRTARKNTIAFLLLELVNTFKKNGHLAVEAKLDLAYENISQIADEFLRLLITGIEQDLQHGDMIGVIKRVSGLIPSIFLSLPFFSTINLLHESRTLLNDLKSNHGNALKQRRKKVLWFTDALNEVESMRGVSPGDGNGGEADDVVIVSFTGQGVGQNSPADDFLPVPVIYSYTLPSPFNATVFMPSLLTSLRMIYDASPDEICVLTPGPLGLLGLLASRLLHVPCTGIYPSMMLHQMLAQVADEKMCMMIEDFTRWFYSLTDTIAVPSEVYADMLIMKGYDRGKLSVYRGPDARAPHTFAFTRVTCTPSQSPAFLQSPV